MERVPFLRALRARPQITSSLFVVTALCAMSIFVELTYGRGLSTTKRPDRTGRFFYTTLEIRLQKILLIELVDDRYRFGGRVNDVEELEIALVDIPLGEYGLLPPLKES